MTAKEFLRELEKTPRTFRWEYLHDNRIRGFLKTDPTRTAFNPIEAVSFLETGQSSLDKDPVGLGLSEFDGMAILDASDGLLWKEIDGRMILDGYCEWIRDGMALAVGLEPFDEDRRAGRGEAVVGPERLAESAVETQRL